MSVPKLSEAKMEIQIFASRDPINNHEALKLSDLMHFIALIPFSPLNFLNVPYLCPMNPKFVFDT